MCSRARSFEKPARARTSKNGSPEPKAVAAGQAGRRGDHGVVHGGLSALLRGPERGACAGRALAAGGGGAAQPDRGGGGAGEGGAPATAEEGVQQRSARAAAERGGRAGQARGAAGEFDRWVFVVSGSVIII